MDRREFFGRLAGAGAVAAALPLAAKAGQRQLTVEEICRAFEVPLPMVVGVDLAKEPDRTEIRLVGSAIYDEHDLQKLVAALQDGALSITEFNKNAERLGVILM